MQYVAPDGSVAAAAEASFLTLSHAPGQAMWLMLYRRLPGFAAAAEFAYAFVARHRTGCHRLSRFLWGPNFLPPRHELVRWLFLRLFGLVYLSAFVSFAVQAPGLIGSHGILPLSDLVEAAAGQLGASRYWLMPMVFWWNSSDTAIAWVCWSGAALSLLLTLGVLPRLMLLFLSLLYLSLLYAGQTFMTFQWDVFLLETGAMALILASATLPGIWLMRWLLVRFMFMSGVVKLASGDASWWNLSALSYHFLTQPLPTPLAWYAARLPGTALRVGTAAMFMIELLLPFLIFFPRRLRFGAAFGILLLQSCIVLTGNYNWFNLQTMLLCLPLFDDAAVRRIVPGRLAAYAARRPARRFGRPAAIGIAAVALLIVFCGLVEMDIRFGGNPPAFAEAVDRAVAPLHVVNGYGLFAVMTTERDEIVIEGSDDGVTWREYEFRYKPGDVRRAPRWIIPHQPRLDWQMWFAALGDPQYLPWFWHFIECLLRNDAAVTALLANDPFPDRPPTYIRAAFYRYTFSSDAEKAQGIWWDRTFLRSYFPHVRLRQE